MDCFVPFLVDFYHQRCEVSKEPGDEQALLFVVRLQG